MRRRLAGDLVRSEIGFRAWRVIASATTWEPERRTDISRSAAAVLNVGGITILPVRSMNPCFPSTVTMSRPSSGPSRSGFVCCPRTETASKALPITAGLHDRRPTGDDGRSDESVSVAPQDDVNLRHAPGEVNVVALGDGAVRRLPHAAVAHADDYVRAFGAQTPHHVLGDCDGIGKSEGTGIDRELDGIGAHHAEQSEPDASALDQHVAADCSGTAQRLQTVKS